MDFGTNAEMRWDSVRTRDYLTRQSRLFVRNHTATPLIDASTYTLAIFGDALRLVVPGWVGIASIKWLGSLEVSSAELTSPWNTTWYRMTGPGYPADAPPLGVNPVRSAWELPWDAVLPARPHLEVTGRSWSGAGPVARIDVSTDGGQSWSRATVLRPGHRGGWTQWAHIWRHPSSGDHELLARATDVLGRTQPLSTPFNDGGYFFDAVVRHPVTVG